MLAIAHTVVFGTTQQSVSCLQLSEGGNDVDCLELLGRDFDCNTGESCVAPNEMAARLQCATNGRCSGIVLSPSGRATLKTSFNWSMARIKAIVRALPTLTSWASRERGHDGLVICKQLSGQLRVLSAPRWRV